MGTKNISFPDEIEKYIDAKVASGEYSHASEVVRDGVRLLMEHEAQQLERLRVLIKEGCDAADRGELIPSEAIVEHVHRRGMELLEKRKREKCAD